LLIAEAFVTCILCELRFSRMCKHRALVWGSKQAAAWRDFLLLGAGMACAVSPRDGATLGDLCLKCLELTLGVIRVRNVILPWSAALGRLPLPTHPPIPLSPHKESSSFTILPQCHRQHFNVSSSVPSSLILQGLVSSKATITLGLASSTAS
jgi:hypothetical protein